jgi:hypothetical protein
MADYILSFREPARTLHFCPLEHVQTLVPMSTFHLCSTRTKTAPDTSQIRVYPYSLDPLSNL